MSWKRIPSMFELTPLGTNKACLAMGQSWRVCLGYLIDIHSPTASDFAPPSLFMVTMAWNSFSEGLGKSSRVHPKCTAGGRSAPTDAEIRQMEDELFASHNGTVGINFGQVKKNSKRTFWFCRNAMSPSLVFFSCSFGCHLPC